jgi:hypothetical protein
LAKFLERDYDVLIMLGDFTERGPKSQVDEILPRVEKAGIRTLAIPGNCDPKPAQEILEKHGINLHSKSTEIDGVTFVGLGGSNLTPFNTPFEITEGEIKEELSTLTSNVDRNWVLATHAPPYGTSTDLTSSDIHVGSKSIREIIEHKQPLVAMCGHVHEARSTDKLGRTIIVNPGPISRGYAAEVILGDGVHVELLKL